ncbi:hypothetical protein C8Q72DRAFT_184369 [Fomitopsis betulina]|nr:hypothetical protein C8Q72DRAFT_184369 [Fomitopsis betulina]
MSDLDCTCCLLCSACFSGCYMLGSCMAIAFGCPSKVTLDKEGRLRKECPLCGDLAVYPAKASRSMKCFFLSVASISTEKRWVCDSCDWQAPMNEEAISMDPGDNYSRRSTTNEPGASREMNLPN